MKWNPGLKSLTQNGISSVPYYLAQLSKPIRLLTTMHPTFSLLFLFANTPVLPLEVIQEKTKKEFPFLCSNVTKELLPTDWPKWRNFCQNELQLSCKWLVTTWPTDSNKETPACVTMWLTTDCLTGNWLFDWLTDKTASKTVPHIRNWLLSKWYLRCKSCTTIHLLACGSRWLSSLHSQRAGGSCVFSPSPFEFRPEWIWSGHDKTHTCFEKRSLRLYPS